MDDQEYIRKAVELADGWDFYTSIANIEDLVCGSLYAPKDSTCMIDALAAQLVRQVDALTSRTTISFDSNISLHNKVTTVTDDNGHQYGNDDNDRTMNTIKAIVDSRVLSTGGSSQ